MGVQSRFVRQVYLILSAQLLLTMIIAVPLQMRSSSLLVRNRCLVKHRTVLALGVAVCIASASSYTPQLARKFPSNYIFLFISTVAEAFLLGMMSSVFSAASVVICASATVLICLGLTVYAWGTESNFTGMGPYLFGAVLS